MAPTKPKTSGAKGASKHSSKSSSAASAAKGKKAGSAKPTQKPSQLKTKSGTTSTKKKKPPHMRYTEKELKVPQLNGIRPAGVLKPPNAKKGKNFVDDKDSMNAILAMVMAEKEGNIESKMMRARQLEEVREARKLEAEKRSESKKAGFEERKQEIKDHKKKRQVTVGDAVADQARESKFSKLATKKPKKRVSFG